VLKPPLNPNQATGSEITVTSDALAHDRRCHGSSCVAVVSKWAYSKVCVTQVYMSGCDLYSIWHMNGDTHV